MARAHTLSRTRAVRSESVPKELGGLIREHGTRREAIPSAVAVFGLTLLAALAAAGVGFYRWYFAYAEYGPAVVWRWAAPAWWAAVALLVLSWYFLFRAWRLGRRRVRVYAGGLAVLEGKRGRAFPWADIHQLFIGGVRYGALGWVWRDRAWLQLNTYQRERIHLGFPLADLDSLAVTVKKSVYPRLLAEARQRFNAGETVSFGPVSLDRQGFHAGKRTILWAEVRGATIDAGRLAVEYERAGRRHRLRLGTVAIPNADLCLQLIQSLGPAK
jgi:hypothetical protein